MEAANRDMMRENRVTSGIQDLGLKRVDKLGLGEKNVGPTETNKVHNEEQEASLSLGRRRQVEDGLNEDADMQLDENIVGNFLDNLPDHVSETMDPKEGRPPAHKSILGRREIAPRPRRRKGMPDG